MVPLIPRWALASVAAAALTMAPPARPLAVAAASDLQVVLPAVTSAFERATGHHVEVSFGSSGNFVTQIMNGAPFDVLLSADLDYPRQIERAGLAEPGTLTRYATGSLVLWTRVALGAAAGQGLGALRSDRVRHIAIANPAHAPYGRAAVAALRTAGLYDALRAKLVFGENVSQAVQFVESGNAEAGIIPQSLASAAGASGQFTPLSSALYPPIEQAAIVVRASGNKDTARAFLAFLSQPATRALLAHAGFGPPPVGR